MMILETETVGVMLDDLRLKVHDVLGCCVARR